MYNFDEYKKLGEPDKKEKSENWEIAIGLQQVDGLTPSNYLIETAKANIEGDITFSEVKERIHNYYKTSIARKEIENRTEEADKVSARIAEILSEKTFVFRPSQYISIHKRIFEGFKYAGKIRTYNITKDEWVLQGKTVLYASADTILETLDYDFNREKSFRYKNLDEKSAIYHIADFISGIWQIHPFEEGNTRATAVFVIKYLQTFGYNVNNDLFSQHSWYFRNALVRANYSDLQKKIYPNTQFLYAFFDNLLFGAKNELKNRTMLVEYEGQNVPINVPINEGLQNVLQYIKENNSITAFEISEKLHLSEKTIKRRIKELKDTHFIERVGSNKTGFWKVLKDVEI